MKTDSIDQFLIVISPSESLSQFASYKKKYLRNHLGRFESAGSIPHITLFDYEDKHNDSRLYDLELKAAQFSPFTLYTTSYDVFDHGDNRTIYMKFIYNEPAREIVKKLDNRAIIPHLTIARNLSPKEFDKAWRLLKNDSFNYCSPCNYITVLKREPGDFWNNYMQLNFKR